MQGGREGLHEPRDLGFSFAWDLSSRCKGSRCAQRRTAVGCSAGGDWAGAQASEWQLLGVSDRGAQV